MKRMIIRSVVVAAIIATVVGLFAVSYLGVNSVLGGSSAKADTPVAMNHITTTCGYRAGMTRQVDPIVSPGISPSAHLHDIFGPVDLNQNSDSGTDRFPLAPDHLNDPGYHNGPGGSGLTTCFTYNDHANYWFPHAYLGGNSIEPYLMYETWQSPVGSKVAVPPFGMTSVIGDSHATAPEDNHVTFNCGSLDGPQYQKPMDCSSVPGGVVTAQIVFPDCWDGSTAFDTPAGIGMSHFAYSNSGVCPSGMVPCADGSTKSGVPFKAIAQLVTRETWRDPVTGQQLRNPNDAQGNLILTFASGAYYTYHGDFMQTWSMEVLGNMVDACLNHGHLTCGPVISGITIIGFTSGPGLS